MPKPLNWKTVQGAAKKTLSKWLPLPKHTHILDMVKMNLTGSFQNQSLPWRSFGGQSGWKTRLWFVPFQQSLVPVLWLRKQSSIVPPSPCLSFQHNKLSWQAVLPSQTSSACRCRISICTEVNTWAWIGRNKQESRSGETCLDAIKCKPGRRLPCCWPSQAAPNSSSCQRLLLQWLHTASPQLNHAELGCWQASAGFQRRGFICICCFLYLKYEPSLSCPLLYFQCPEPYLHITATRRTCVDAWVENRKCENALSMASSAFSALVHPRGREDPSGFAFHLLHKKEAFCHCP